MNIIFYMTPGSCSTGIHLLLEELELIFEVQLVNLLAGDQRQTEFLAINPKGNIPVLITDTGEPLTDFVSICWWLANRYPKANLIPDDKLAQARTLEQITYAVSYLHGEGFTRIFTPERYLFHEEDRERLEKQGRTIVKKGLTWFDTILQDREYLSGDFGIADAALFYNEFWANRMKIPLPSACERHFQRMLSRSAVRRVMAEEGYHSIL